MTFPNKGYIQGKHLELVGSSYVNGNVVTDNDYFVIKMYRNLPHNVTKNTYDKIQKLFDKYTYEYEFDREDVEELLNLKKTRVFEILTMLLNSDLIEHSYSTKYKFKK